MRQFTQLLITSVALLVAAVAAPLPAQSKPPSEAEEWLAEVAPIITRMEREVFLKLQTKADRDKFVAFFWKQRDPQPDTEVNEFLKAYQERISFADRTFHDGSSRRGSRTERGYYYLLLGAPLERQTYTTLSQLWPVELWFCRGEARSGLPDFFYLMFYQPEGQGPWRLYSPTIDGPERLAVPTMNNRAPTRQNAYLAIKEVAAPVAGASLSLFPGEKPMTTASFTSDSLLAQVRSLPERIYSDAYARSYLEFKDYVETEYSDSYIECSALVRVFRREGRFFADWSVEPSRMSFESRQGSAVAVYELVLKLEKPDGSPLLERTEEIPLRMTAEQYKANERRRIAFQDVLPLAAGEARLLILLKNKTAKDFCSFQARLSVPAEAAGPQLGDLLLYHGREDLPEAQRKNVQAFVLDGRRFAFNARNEFLPRESLGAFVQALRPGRDAQSLGASVRLDVKAFPKERGPAAGVQPPSTVRSKTLLVSEVLDAKTGAVDFGSVPLEGLNPGYYQAALSFLDAGGREVLSRHENFIVLAVPSPILPWVFARPHPPFPYPEALTMLAQQSFLSGDYEEAAKSLNESLAKKDDPAARILLGRTLYAQGRYRDSIAAVEALHKASPSRETSKLLALDLFSLGDWAGCLALCEALLREGTEVSVLNTAAECLVKLDRAGEALPLLEKSLQIAPDQPAARALRDKIR